MSGVDARGCGRFAAAPVETTKRTGRGSRPSTSCSGTPRCRSARSSAAPRSPSAGAPAGPRAAPRRSRACARRRGPEAARRPGSAPGRRPRRPRPRRRPPPRRPRSRTTVVRRRNCARDRELEPFERHALDDERQVGEQGVRCSLRTARVSSVTELTDFGLIVLLVAGTFSLAIAAYKLTELFPIPAPALFLVAAAVASDIWPGPRPAVDGRRRADRGGRADRDPLRRRHAGRLAPLPRRGRCRSPRSACSARSRPRA